MSDHDAQTDSTALEAARQEYAAALAEGSYDYRRWQAADILIQVQAERIATLENAVTSALIVMADTHDKLLGDSTKAVTDNLYETSMRIIRKTRIVPVFPPDGGTVTAADDEG